MQPWKLGFLLPALAAAVSFEPVPELQELWNPPNDSVALPARAWLGGDSDWSIPLPNGSSLWIFGDTFVGAYDAAAQQRIGAGMAMPHDTIAMVAPNGSSARKWWNTTAQGAPTAWFRPQTALPGGGQDYLWIMSGYAPKQASGSFDSPQGLTILGSRVRLNGTGSFGFEIVRTTVVSVVDVSAGPPSNWEYSTCDFNATGFETGLFWHSDVFPQQLDDDSEDPMMMVVGQRQDPQQQASARMPSDPPRAGVMMRLPLSSLARCSYDGGAMWASVAPSGPDWAPVSDTRPPEAALLAPLFEPDDSELTITRMPACAGTGWFSAYIPFLSDTLRVRTAQTPTGPWSDDPAAAFPMPWPANDTKRYFSYAPKAHPELDAAWGGSCGSVITYVTNSFQIGTLFQPGTAGVYTPQVWRINWD